MLTLFSIPKAFEGHIGVIQGNAIRSWTLLRPACEIILLGEDRGTAECAAEFGLHYIPTVERNEYGTPLLNDLFGKAEQTATNDLLCCVNADIILMIDFMNVVKHFAGWDRPFLLIGLRWDVDLLEPWNFDDPNWEARLRNHVKEHGRPHHIGGMDYFVFRRGLFGQIPPFAIGRCVWDNWLVYRARSTGAAVVNITNAVIVVHQNHDYSHVSYSPSLQGRFGIDRGPERLRNMELAGWPLEYFDLRHATHTLSIRNDNIKKDFSGRAEEVLSGVGRPLTREGEMRRFLSCGLLHSQRIGEHVRS